MQKVTVLHYSPIWLEQTQTWIYSQVAALQRMGVDTHIACEHVENLDQFPIKNIHCQTDVPVKWRYIYKYLRLVRMQRQTNHLVTVGREIGAQILHSHFGHIGWTNLGAARRLKAKHVVTFYGLDVNKLPTQFSFWRRRYEELFSEVDLILCEGSHMAKCITALGCSMEKVRIQRLGVNVRGIEFRPRTWNPDIPLKVLMAASFREKKGLPYAIEALGLLGTRLPLNITIVGDAGPDSTSQIEKKKIVETIERVGLAAHTRLLGYQSHDALFREAFQHHIFISPSITASDGDTEGGAPVVLIEMAASGMPIVSSMHCDIPEVVQHGITGLLAPERDVDGLFRHLTWLIENPEKWPNMLDASRHHVELNYDVYTEAENLLTQYKELLV